ncbi:YtxH domain-containing protein [Ilyomonas limi]|uniref:YtxH domain-containing protein n=1 Tax=Ilyomonas limi TaxID=2575867 RepID=A0A4U3L0H0_9BACT|nr:YtxH domain-containing protein [Ilyomonas limi]TKK68591.1 YtxH domain-containing protein [Ilyomonas limi]
MHPLSFIRGALFGAFVMYLFAPRSGAETRRMFAQKGEDLKNTLGNIADTVANEVSAQPTETDEAVVIASGTYRPMTYQQ